MVGERLRIRPTKPRSSWRGLILNARAGNPSRARRRSRAISAITQSPISAMITVCSATEEGLGIRMPSRGWFQRSSPRSVISPGPAQLGLQCSRNSRDGRPRPHYLFDFYLMLEREF